MCAENTNTTFRTSIHPDPNSYRVRQFCSARKSQEATWISVFIAFFWLSSAAIRWRHLLWRQIHSRKWSAHRVAKFVLVTRTSLRITCFRCFQEEKCDVELSVWCLRCVGITSSRHQHQNNVNSTASCRWTSKIQMIAPVLLSVRLNSSCFLVLITILICYVFIPIVLISWSCFSLIFQFYNSTKDVKFVGVSSAPARKVLFQNVMCRMLSRWMASTWWRMLSVGRRRVLELEPGRRVLFSTEYTTTGTSCQHRDWRQTTTSGDTCFSTDTWWMNCYYFPLSPWLYSNILSSYLANIVLCGSEVSIDVCCYSCSPQIISFHIF